MLSIIYFHLDFDICQELSHVHGAHVLCVTCVPGELQESAGSHSILGVFLRKPTPTKTNKFTSTTCCSWTKMLMNNQELKSLRKKRGKNLPLNFDRFFPSIFSAWHF